MTVKFDFETFANTLAQQAHAAIPAEINEQYKNFLVQVIHDFAIKAGGVLVEEDNILSSENIQTIIQYIAEWTYRKGLDLVNSEIPPSEWMFILQTIAGGIFEAGKRTMIAGSLDENTINSIIQGEVQSHFTHALNQLKQQGKINDDQIYSIEQAKQKTHEQIIPDQVQSQAQKASQMGAKESKLATIGFILATMPEEKSRAILNTFSPEEADTIRFFMQPENLDTNLDMNTAYKLLNSLKNTIAPAEAPNQMAKNIQKMAQSTNPVKLLSQLAKERPIVQNYVKACIEGKFIRRDFSPHLAKIVIKYLESQLTTGQLKRI